MSIDFVLSGPEPLFLECKLSKNHSAQAFGQFYEFVRQLGLRKEQWQLTDVGPTVVTDGLEQHPDGPEPPDRFWYRGEWCRIPPGYEWELCNLMWDKRNADIDDVMKAVWHELVDRQRLYQRVSHLNKALRSLSYPWRLQVSKRWLTWEPMQEHGDSRA
jgi:hypothetical protein